MIVHAIDKSTQKRKMSDATCTEHYKLLTKNRPSMNHVKVCKELYKKIYSAR